MKSRKVISIIGILILFFFGGSIVIVSQALRIDHPDKLSYDRSQIEEVEQSMNVPNEEPAYQASKMIFEEPEAGAKPISPAQKPVSEPFASPTPIPSFANEAVKWLVDAQYDNGGWGAGSHRAQNINNPHAVKVDPATTAFSAMALMRAGHSINKGAYQENVRKALFYMVDLIDQLPENATKITDVTGTQPQVKLGQNIDASFATQFFVRILPDLAQDPQLKQRVEKALDRCIKTLEQSQNIDGSWANGGWAGVLQSSMSYNALEIADNAGYEVSEVVIKEARKYQNSNVNPASGSVETSRAAGVTLYSVAGSSRSSAKESRRARDVISEAKRTGKLSKNDEVNKANLVKAGIAEEEAEDLSNNYKVSQKAADMMDNESVLSGFGNNGGEEFLSFLMTSEAKVIEGGDAWKDWQAKMTARLNKIQNKDGSWSGHHCITSPVFCTSAVILTVTADHDAEFLLANAK